MVTGWRGEDSLPTALPPHAPTPSPPKSYPPSTESYAWRTGSVTPPSSSWKSDGAEVHTGYKKGAEVILSVLWAAASRVSAATSMATKKPKKISFLESLAMIALNLMLTGL